MLTHPRYALLRYALLRSMDVCTKPDGVVSPGFAITPSGCSFRATHANPTTRCRVLWFATGSWGKWSDIALVCGASTLAGDRSCYGSCSGLLGIEPSQVRHDHVVGCMGIAALATDA